MKQQFERKYQNEISFNIAGTSHDNRQGYIHYINNNKNAYLMFRRDSKNPYDKNAVQIIGYVPDGKIVNLGFVPCKLAPYIADALDNNKGAYIKSYKIIGNKNYTGMNVTARF